MACSGSEKVVELGFVENTPSWLLKSKFFRCKVGGKPAWLTLENLPNPDSLQCKNCNKPCAFLLQVYAPVDDLDDAFHRTIFLFMCKNGQCSKKNSSLSFVVFRSQLPRRNQYYGFEPPVEVETGSDEPSASQFTPLCDVCGCRSAVNCANCTDRKYCSEYHRELDWQGGHQAACGTPSVESNEGKKKKKKNKMKFILPEYELITDTEVLTEEEKKEKSDEEKMKEYHQFMKSAKAKNCIQDGQFDDIESFVKKPDKFFNKFQKRVAVEPEQVLRYQRGGVPLWVSSEHQPSAADIPDCACGAKRNFEFQVMPQLLNHLSLDSVGKSVDWGTIIIYTCSKSCNLGTSAYVEEFVWKQDFSDDKEHN